MPFFKDPQTEKYFYIPDEVTPREGLVEVDEKEVEASKPEVMEVQSFSPLTRKQFRLSLLAANSLDTVEEWLLDTPNKAAKIIWECAEYIEREDELSQALEKETGFTANFIDSVFLSGTSL